MEDYKQRVQKTEQLIFETIDATAFPDFLMDVARLYVVNKTLNAVEEQELNKKKVMKSLSKIAEARQTIADLKQQLFLAFDSYENVLKEELDSIEAVQTRQNGEVLNDENRNVHLGITDVDLKLSVARE